MAYPFPACLRHQLGYLAVSADSLCVCPAKSLLGHCGKQSCPNNSAHWSCRLAALC